MKGSADAQYGCGASWLDARGTWASTYLVPFELLLLAYVVLGPGALRDRNFLAARPQIFPAPARRRDRARRVAIIAALIDNASWFGFVMWSAFVMCALLAATTTAVQGIAVGDRRDRAHRRRWR